MDSSEARGKAMAGSVEDWATESLLAAREAYQDPATAMRIKSGTRLGDANQEANLPVVSKRTVLPVASANRGTIRLHGGQAGHPVSSAAEPLAARSTPQTLSGRPADPIPVSSSTALV